MKRFVLSQDMVVAGKPMQAGDTIGTLDSVVDLGTLAAMAGTGAVTAGPEPEALKPAPKTEPKPAAKSSRSKKKTTPK